MFSHFTSDCVLIEGITCGGTSRQRSGEIEIPPCQVCFTRLGARLSRSLPNENKIFQYALKSALLFWPIIDIFRVNLFRIFTDRFLWLNRQSSNLNSDVVRVEKIKLATFLLVAT